VQHSMIRVDGAEGPVDSEIPFYVQTIFVGTLSASSFSVPSLGW
jgi:hypothetical protein